MNVYERRVKKGLAITSLAITNDILMVVAMTHGILVSHIGRLPFKILRIPLDE